SHGTPPCSPLRQQVWLAISCLASTASLTGGTYRMTSTVSVARWKRSARSRPDERADIYTGRERKRDDRDIQHDHLDVQNTVCHELGCLRTPRGGINFHFGRACRSGRPGKAGTGMGSL